MKSRLPVKRVRDFLKKDYEKESSCFICGSQQNLELHHAFSVSDLWNTWLKTNGLNDKDPVLVNQYREQFAIDCADPLSHTYTLCKSHHVKLHSIYGATYSNYMGKRVIEWILKQKENYNAGVG